MANFYEELNVKTTATREEIAQAYKYLARKYHPDLYDGDKEVARKKMASVNEAYATLSDAEKRDMYDRQNNINQPAATYYEELGVTEKSSPEEITLAYKTLARKYHPDIFDGDKEVGAKKMTAVNNAYDTLSDPEKREKYDRKLSGNYSVTAPKKKFPIIAVISAVALVIAGVIIALILLGNVPEYTLTYNNDENCTIDGPAIQTIKEGSKGVSVEVIPRNGYLFVGWQDENGIIVSTNPVRQDTASKNMTLTAICAEAVTVSYTVSGIGGTLSRSGTWNVAKGSSVTITATPIEGYEFAGWSDSRITATRTDTIDGPISVTATFRVKTYSVEIYAGAGGQLNINDFLRDSYSRANVGHVEEFTIIATPNQGYKFVCWQDTNTEEVLSTNATWIVTSNINITAIFELE